MRKLRFIFSFCAILSLFSSCENQFMNIEDISFITSKTSMQSFSHLNEPIVITMPVYQKQGLWGSSGSTRKTQVGDIFVVYDWESGTVFDWAFFAGKHGLSNWRAVEMGTPTKYYDAGEASGLIGCLDPETGNITVIKNAVHGTFANLNNNNAVKSRYGMIQTFGFANNEETYTVYPFDSAIGKVSNESITVPVYTSGNVFTPCADSDGNYWISYQHNDFNYLAKFDCSCADVEKFRGFPMNRQSTYEVMSLLCVTDRYVVVSDDIAPYYPNVVIYDKENMGEPYKEILLPYLDPDGKFLFRICEIDGMMYAIFARWGEGEIWKLDVNAGGFKRISSFDFDFTETVYVRGTRIYFINSRNLQRFACMYYDTASGTVGEVQSFTFDEIVVQ